MTTSSTPGGASDAVAPDASVVPAVVPSFDPRLSTLVPPDKIPASAVFPPIPRERLKADFLRRHVRARPQYEPESLGDSMRQGITHPTAAAVLIPLVVRAHEVSVLLTQRTTRLKKHAGQVAFPGGRKDPEDQDVVATALRESEEEIGLLAHEVEVLGSLKDYFTGTGYQITPVIGLVSPPSRLRLQASEVDAVFEVPLSFLMNPENHQYRERQFEGVTRHFYSMPYRATQWIEEQGQVSDPLGREFFIWGATASMLRNLHRLLAAS
jgi:8-oxo-dGTP pyrophosphatase MutT (NUDIX family)